MKIQTKLYDVICEINIMKHSYSSVSNTILLQERIEIRYRQEMFNSCPQLGDSTIKIFARLIKITVERKTTSREIDQ